MIIACLNEAMSTLSENFKRVLKTEAQHKLAVERKQQKVLMYDALLDEWELRDPDYARELRVKRRAAKCQLDAMNPR